MITLTYNPESGQVVHNYPDGYKSITDVNPDDAYHAERLGITAKEHRLMHEAAHQLVGHYFIKDYPFQALTPFTYPEYGCPIIYKDMRGLELPRPKSQLLEWRITCATYHAFGVLYEHNIFGGLMDIEKAGGNPYEIQHILKYILYISTLGKNMDYKVNSWLKFKTV